jgi:hypothetical protein
VITPSLAGVAVELSRIGGWDGDGDAPWLKPEIGVLFVDDVVFVDFLSHPELRMPIAITANHPRMHKG